jgi:hypothetical protein
MDPEFDSARSIGASHGKIKDLLAFKGAGTLDRQFKVHPKGVRRRFR